MNEINFLPWEWHWNTHTMRPMKSVVVHMVSHRCGVPAGLRGAVPEAQQMEDGALRFCRDADAFHLMSGACTKNKDGPAPGHAHKEPQPRPSGPQGKSRT